MAETGFIGIETAYVNERTETALRLLRDVVAVERVDGGYVATLAASMTSAAVADLSRTISMFGFASDVVEHGEKPDPARRLGQEDDDFVEEFLRAAARSVLLGAA